MESYTYNRIQITGGLNIKELLKLELSVKANQHGRAIIVGFMDMEKTDWKESLKNHLVQINLLKKDLKTFDKVLFTGYIERAEKNLLGEKLLIKLHLSSATIALDRKIKSKSFQDTSWSYVTIIKNTIADTQHAGGIFLIGEDTCPTKPLIQYCETNWNFILRLASHFHSVVYPDIKENNPKFYFGMPKKNKATEFLTEEFIKGISSHFYNLGGTQCGYAKKDFQYYKVFSYQPYEIGTIAEFQGEKYQICQMDGKLIGNEMFFTYLLGKPAIVGLRRRQNSLFAGMSLLGNVLSVKGEKVKIHLDIDKSQPETTAYPYEWVPDTGSVMYCMPQVGTRVSLYFSNAEESSAMAINCVRTNGEECSKTSNTEDRYLETEYGKEMVLKPDSMGIDTEDTRHSMSMFDEEGIRFGSSKNITIVAEKELKLKGKNVHLETPTKLKMAKY